MTSVRVKCLQPVLSESGLAKVASVPSSTDGSSTPSFTHSASDVHFTCIEPSVTMTKCSLRSECFIGLPDKSCALDPLPTPTLKSGNGVLAPQPFSKLRTSSSPRLRKIDLDSSNVRSCAVQSPIYQSFRSYLKDSLLASSFHISTRTVCYQDSSRRIELTTQRRPLC